jgi:hypothetical protein
MPPAGHHGIGMIRRQSARGAKTPGPGADRRAISVQLDRVTRGQPRSFATRFPPSSESRATARAATLGPEIAASYVSPDLALPHLRPPAARRPGVRPGVGPGQRRNTGPGTASQPRRTDRTLRSGLSRRRTSAALTIAAVWLTN